MGTKELQIKKRIFGTIARTSRKDGNLSYLLCKCGSSTIFLEREMVALREIQNIPKDTPIEKLLQDDCSTCNPGHNHTVRVV